MITWIALGVLLVLAIGTWLSDISPRQALVMGWEWLVYKLRGQ